MDFDVLLGQVIGQAADRLPFDNPETQLRVRLLAKLQQHLSGQWKMAGRTGIACTLRQRDQHGRILKCVEPMAGTCIACRNPVCVHHAAPVLENGDLICFACIEFARQTRVKNGEQAPNGAGRDSERGTESAEERSASDDELRKKYLKRLKLTGDPTDDEIKAAFRREAAKAHPDRAPADKKDKAHAKFVALGEAKDWLLKNCRKKAA